MKRILHSSWWILVFVMMMAFSCTDNTQRKVVKTNEEILQEMMEYNTKAALFEEEVIKRYIADHHAHMTRTGTGLWYEIYDKGQGDSLLDGNTLSIDYSVYMVNDSLCYTSDSTGVYTFRLGMSDIESGIHEGMKFLRKGGKARFIMPSHLAFGLMGDMKKIPPKTPVIYDVHLLDVR